MLSEETLQYIREHPAGKVKIALTDIDGILRGKYIGVEKFLSLIHSESGFCDVVFGWDASDVSYDNVRYTGWHTGYPDAPMRIDLNTFRKIPWESDLPFFLGEMAGTSEKPAYVCPRLLYKRVLEEVKSAGFNTYVSQEFEWFNFLETPASAKRKGYANLEPLSPGMFGYSILRSTLNNPFFTDLFGLLAKFDVPLEGLHTETGPGVLEAAIRYAEGLVAGDRAVLFKTAVKEIGYRHGVLATFMAKVNEHLPGCGGHIHQSLWDDNHNTNLFHDDNDPLHMSELMKQYVAGQLHCLPHLLPMYAPNVNSYKRLVEGAWAPTTLTWGLDNRTVAIRVLCNGNASARIETRVAGSDVNPYLAMGASLASGLYGIRHNLKLEQPATTGNGYLDFSYGSLPTNLIESAGKMKNSDIAKELFGEQFVEHFTSTREWEWRQHLKVVTDWERARYLEII